MKALKTLLKIQTYKVDQILKIIKGLERALYNQKNALTTLEQNEQAEMKNCSQVEFFSHLESYLRHNSVEQSNCHNEIRNLENKLFNERSKLKEEFNEMKKIDILLEEKKKHQKLEGDRKHSSQQDELNIIRYAYTQSSEQN